MIMVRVIKFGADWCSYCKMLTNTLKDVQTDVQISEIDIDKNKDIVRDYNIRGVPTLVMLDGNTEIKRITGMMMKNELEGWLNG